MPAKKSGHHGGFILPLRFRKNHTALGRPCSPSPGNEKWREFRVLPQWSSWRQVYQEKSSFSTNRIIFGGVIRRISFSEPLKLAQGPHNIEVKAKNLPGKISIREIVIHVDREGPTITLEQVRVDKGRSKKNVVLKGLLQILMVHVMLM